MVGVVRKRRRIIHIQMDFVLRFSEFLKSKWKICLRKVSKSKASAQTNVDTSWKPAPWIARFRRRLISIHEIINNRIDNKSRFIGSG